MTRTTLASRVMVRAIYDLVKTKLWLSDLQASGIASMPSKK